MATWQPSTTQVARVARDTLYRQIRSFFQQRHFIEVDPPLLGNCGSTDPHLHSLTTLSENTTLYLQTSPEFFMKRLLAAESGPIYSMTKSFRQGEQGRHHNIEFTILEWYQPGFNDHKLMAQVGEFFKHVLESEIKKRSYRDCFLEFTHLNPHTAELKVLEQFGSKALNVSWQNTDRDTWLDAIFSHCVQPNLQGAICVFDYPISQAALARTDTNEFGEGVARRFEVFAKGLELGNGYWELNDGDEQARRFQADLGKRKTLGLEPMVADEKLVSALRDGFPNCAGIAIGVDRLLMLKTGANSIEEVMDFPLSNL